MPMFVIARKEPADDWDRKYHAVVGDRVLFSKDKMGKNTAVLYVTREAANRAMAQIYHPEQWDVVNLARFYEPQSDGRGGIW